MKRFAPTATLSLMALGLLLTLATCGTDAPAAKNSNVVWTENYKAALESAKRDNKVVVLHFTGSDWCPPCKALDANVLTSDAFAKWSKDKVLVDLDYPHDKPQSDEVKKQNADLATEYKV